MSNRCFILPGESNHRSVTIKLIETFVNGKTSQFFVDALQRFLSPFRCPSLHSIVIKKLENSMLGLWFYGFSKSVPLTVYQAFKSICPPGDISTIMGSE